MQTVSARRLLDGSAAARKELETSWLVWGAVAFGVVCRLAQYAASTSLWHDESFVALIALHTRAADLLGPLDWNEASPPGFLLVEKLIASWLGPSEYALRLVPQLAGLAVLPAFAVLSRRVAGPGLVRLWAVVLLVVSDQLIAQANQVKHFSLDLVLSIGLTWLAIEIWERERPTRPLLAWGGLAAAGLWLSYSTAFVFAGTSAWLAWRRLRTWQRTERWAYWLANLLVLASFTILLTPIRLQRTGAIVDFWSSAFPDPSSAPRLLYWLGRVYLGLFHYVAEPARVCAPVLFLIGIVAYVRHRRAELLLLCAPLAVCFAASCLRFWPFGGNQHMAFAVPAVLLIVAAGVEWTRQRLSSWHPSAAAAFVVVLLLPATATCVYRLAAPRYRHELRPVIEFVQQHTAPGDALLVLDPATFAFYTGRDLRSQSLQPPADASVWVITPWSRDGGSPPHAIVEGLQSRRPRLDAYEAAGAAAFLFGPERVAGP